MSKPARTINRPAPPDPRIHPGGNAMPPRIGEVLDVVRILLAYGRHLAATLEHRAAFPGFFFIARFFGTSDARAIAARLYRGVLRAIALEAMLLKRAASGRDVCIPMPRVRGVRAPRLPGPVAEPAAAGAVLNAAGRAAHDAPPDPDRIPTLRDIVAEVSRRAIGRTVADICRDFGISPRICSGRFQQALLLAIIRYDGSEIRLADDMARRSDRFRMEHPNDPTLEWPELSNEAVMRRALGFCLGEEPVDPHPHPQADAPAPDAPGAETVGAPVATGPPAPGELPIAA